MTTHRLLPMLLCLLALGGCDHRGDTVELKLGHGLDTTHSVHKAMVFMGERLQQISSGKMTLQIYPSGQLGSERELIELLQIGSLAMTKASASPLEGFVPEFKVFSIPYLFRDHAHFWRVLESTIGRDLLAKTSVVKLHGLGYFDAGARSFYTINHPANSPADLRGEKIRVQQSATSVEMIKHLGGAATPIAWGELYTALQQGVVDGAENNPPSFYLSKHYEVARYYSLDEHTYVPDVLLLSKPIWETLTQQQREWLVQAVDESIHYQRELWQEATEDALEALVAAGVKIIHPDKLLFARQLEPMYSQYQGTTIGNIINDIAKTK